MPSFSISYALCSSHAFGAPFETRECAQSFPHALRWDLSLGRWLQEDTFFLERRLVERPTAVTQSHHVSSYYRMHQELLRSSVLTTEDCAQDGVPFSPVPLQLIEDRRLELTLSFHACKQKKQSNVPLP